MNSTAGITLMIISIHALRVEGDLHRAGHHLAGGISIHALRVEGDGYIRRGKHRQAYFYPRPPGGGRPQIPLVVERTPTISIHALRVEGDRLYLLPIL